MSFTAIFTSVWAVPKTVLTDDLRIFTSRTLPVACDNVILLSATVIGDPVGHTFEWVQISGTPVTWLESRFQTNVMFEQTTTRDDKKFNFIVDKGRIAKGKNIEKVFEILVSAIPTDILTTTIGMSAGLVTSDIKTHLYEAQSNMVPALRQAGSQIINDSMRAILYKTPIPVTGSNASVLVKLYSVSGDTFTLNKVSSFKESDQALSIFNMLDMDTNYAVSNTSFGKEIFKERIAQSSSFFNSTQELSLVDSDKVNTNLNPSGLYLSGIVEKISRELTTLEITENVLQWITPRHGTNSSIVEKISRTLTLVDQTTDAALNSDTTIGTSIGGYSGQTSSIIEVKQFQYSSLG